jgi:UDP-2,4-diacetamido-2,4,6-trideoxy-beta-L-altropyranose hydrolase
MAEQKIIFRADGNTQMGLGHIYRCLALAEIIADDFDCFFYIQNPSIEITKEILKVCKGINALEETNELLNEANELPIEKGAIVILDGYHFNTPYQQVIKDKGAALVCIDDLADKHFVADAIINHNPYLADKAYSMPLSSKLYQGVQYALIRPVFFTSRHHTETNDIKSAFICFGGSDSKNITLKATQACLKAGIPKITVVTGSSYIFLGEFEKLIGDSHQVRHVVSATADQMAAMIKESDFAICPSSTIAFEAATIGTAIITGYYTENQHLIEKFLSTENCAYSIGDFTSATVSDLVAAIGLLPELARDQKTNQQRIFVDSSTQLKKIFKKLVTERKITIRNATKKDIHLYFDWANEPVTRFNAINQGPISWNDHQLWFDKKLSDPGSFLYLGEMEEQPIGQIRFDFISEGYEISYSLDKAFRGKGLADSILSKGIEKLIEENKSVSCLKAKVVENNIGSNIAFLRLGFQRESDVMINNRNFLSYYKCQ